jgi:hypothetical protein
MERFLFLYNRFRYFKITKAIIFYKFAPDGKSIPL